MPSGMTEYVKTTWFILFIILRKEELFKNFLFCQLFVNFYVYILTNSFKKVMVSKIGIICPILL